MGYTHKLQGILWCQWLFNDLHSLDGERPSPGVLMLFTAFTSLNDTPAEPLSMQREGPGVGFDYM